MGCCKCEEHKWDDPQPVVYTDPEDDKEYCLFHAPAEHKGVSVDEFNERVSERIQATIDLEDEKALCDFSGTIFPGDMYFTPASTLPEISFNNVSFGEDVSFGEVSFRGSSLFSGASFEGHAIFSKASFDKDTDFSKVSFNGNADFNEASFEWEVNFNEAHFKSIASFEGANFIEEAFFYEFPLRGGRTF